MEEKQELYHKVPFQIFYHSKFFVKDVGLFRSKSVVKNFGDSNTLYETQFA